MSQPTSEIEAKNNEEDPHLKTITNLETVGNFNLMRTMSEMISSDQLAAEPAIKDMISDTLLQIFAKPFFEERICFTQEIFQKNNRKLRR